MFNTASLIAFYTATLDCFCRAVLVVRILKAEELPAYMSQAPDVYMEAKLTPTMTSGQLKTEIHERTSHPSFNEIFDFGLSYEEIRKQTLQFTVCYMDRYVIRRI